MRIEQFVDRITEKELIPSINLTRPKYVQPEDSILYRSHRILIILALLNTKNGISKDVIACVDFLLRNSGYQKKFILEYFKGKTNIIKKLNYFTDKNTVEIDFNIVQYRSVPWDLRFNDMFLFLYVRSLIQISSNNKDKNIRIHLTETGQTYTEKVKEVFASEINFLELFNSSVQEAKAIDIITNIIPQTYWRENEKLNNK